MNGLQGARAARGVTANERTLQGLWETMPNDLDEQARYNLAIDFTNVLKKHQEVSYIKVGITKKRFHISTC